MQLPTNIGKEMLCKIKSTLAKQHIYCNAYCQQQIFNKLCQTKRRRTYIVGRNVNKDIYYFKQCRGSSKVETEQLCNTYIPKYGKKEIGLTRRYLPVLLLFILTKKRN